MLDILDFTDTQGSWFETITPKQKCQLKCTVEALAIYPPYAVGVYELTTHMQYPESLYAALALFTIGSPLIVGGYDLYCFKKCGNNEVMFSEFF